MGKLMINDIEYTLEEYIKSRIMVNLGSQSYATKAQLKAACEEEGIQLTGKEGKEEYYDLLLECGWTMENFENVYGIGVSSQDYQKEFNISHADVKRLERMEVLKVVGKYRFRLYGEYHYAPLYSITQYVRMTTDEMKKLLIQYPKGVRKSKI